MKRLTLLFVGLIVFSTTVVKAQALAGFYKKSEYGKHSGELQRFLIGSDEITTDDYKALSFPEKKSKAMYRRFFNEQFGITSEQAFIDKVNSWRIGTAKSDEWFTENYEVAAYDEDGTIEWGRRNPHHVGERLKAKGHADVIVTEEEHFEYDLDGIINASELCGNMVRYNPKPHQTKVTIPTYTPPCDTARIPNYTYNPPAQQQEPLPQQNPNPVIPVITVNYAYPETDASYQPVQCGGQLFWKCPDGRIRNEGALEQTCHRRGQGNVVNSYNKTIINNYYTNNNYGHGGHGNGGHQGGGNGGGNQTTGNPPQGNNGGSNRPTGSNDPGNSGGEGGRQNIQATQQRQLAQRQQQLVNQQQLQQQQRGNQQRMQMQSQRTQVQPMQQRQQRASFIPQQRSMRMGGRPRG